MSMSVRLQPTIVAADHPSLDGAIDQFLADLRHETRYFGPTAAANPKPFPSLVDGLRHDATTANGGGLRLAAVLDGAVVALARVDPTGQLLVAVAAEHRGRGVGTMLVRSTIERARARGYGRLRLRASRRSRAATSLGATMGFMVVDRGLGRLDLILDLAPASYSA